MESKLEVTILLLLFEKVRKRFLQVKLMSGVENFTAFSNRHHEEKPFVSGSIALERLEMSALSSCVIEEAWSCTTYFTPVFHLFAI